MKINWIKTLICLGVSVSLGLLCFEVAPEVDHRNWIALAISSLSIFICLMIAVACEFPIGIKNANLKVSAWIFSVLVTMTNVIVSIFEYKVTLYLISIMLLTLINVGITYALTQRK